MTGLKIPIIRDAMIKQVSMVGLQEMPQNMPVNNRAALIAGRDEWAVLREFKSCVPGYGACRRVFDRDEDASIQIYGAHNSFSIAISARA